MASNAGAVATEAPPPPSHHSAQAPPPIASATSEDSVRLLKRQREATPPSSDPHGAHNLLALASPAKSARLALASTRLSPPPLTGAAALEDERRRREAEQAANPPASSENPSHRVIASLLSGSDRAMSRPSDAPPAADATTPTESLAKQPPAIAIPSETTAYDGDREETSPQSAGSIAGGGVTASPTPMDIDGKDGHETSHHVVGQDERVQPSSLSYPGSLHATGAMAEPAQRGMSYPIPGSDQTSPSSGSKKHKCPYCNTEFTRHHNLKSHLLTHSQEKPYVCTECPLRFRRLHDLKRHGKLHTGEKPHVCPKCDRKFARGDALARHSKGNGGCAGRRLSMGSFVDGEDFDGSGLGEGDDSAMSGIGYDNGDEDEVRRQSLPAVNAQNITGGESDGFASHSRTYPPALNRPAASGLFPPTASQAQLNSSTSSSIPNSMASNHTPSTSISSVPISGGSAGMYAQTGMTESPKPLSPGVPVHDASSLARQRSPGASQQPQPIQAPASAPAPAPAQPQSVQQSQSRNRQSDLQSPRDSQPPPKLPGLSHPGFSATSTSPGFHHGRTPSGSGLGTQPITENRNMFAQSDPSVWAYIQSLEDKIKLLSDRVLSLDQEVAGLRKQVEGRDSTVADTSQQALS